MDFARCCKSGWYKAVIRAASHPDHGLATFEGLHILEHFHFWLGIQQALFRLGKPDAQTKAPEPKPCKIPNCKSLYKTLTS